VTTSELDSLIIAANNQANGMTEAEYKIWWETWSRQMQLKSALRNRIVYTMYAGMFMLASWVCTYISVAIHFLPMICVALVAGVGTYHAIASVYDLDRKIAELVADLM
jgi:hypothetical protein